jgi:hypothetical protein
MLGEDVRISYPDIYSQFEYTIMERDEATTGNLHRDYHSNPNNYKVLSPLNLAVRYLSVLRSRQ